MRLILLVSVFVLGACGGRAIETGPDGAAGASTSGPVKGNDDSGSTSTPPGTLPSHRLNACVPGFKRASSPSRGCNWLTSDDACFDTKEAACACICPTSADSVCSSGFYRGDGQATLVHCS